MNICVFCENTYSPEVLVCPECQDYKGLMPLALAKITYDFIAENYKEEN